MSLNPWPHYSEEEINAVIAVLRSGKVNYWTGEQGKLFEKEYAAYLGVNHAIALANGTNALELCLRALGLGPGDEVIVPSRTFMASASCVVHVGAKPIVCDIDPISQNLTVESIQPHINSKTKAIIVVHLGGWPCDMPAIMDFAETQGLYVIEDCAQAHGAKIRGRAVGSFGHMAAFSFCQDKIMSTLGEGGLLATNHEGGWKKAWAYKDHGKGYDTVYHTEHAPGFRWLHDQFGSNYRMTEAQAAVGRIQLQNLDAQRKIRQSNAEILKSHLLSLPALRIDSAPAHLDHAFYRFYAFVKPQHLKVGWNRDRIMLEINALGTKCLVGSCAEIYREKAFIDAGLAPQTRFPHAKALGETSLAFMLDPVYDEAAMLKMAHDIMQVVHAATQTESSS